MLLEQSIASEKAVSASLQTKMNEITQLKEQLRVLEEQHTSTKQQFDAIRNLYRGLFDADYCGRYSEKCKEVEIVGDELTQVKQDLEEAHAQLEQREEEVWHLQAILEEKEEAIGSLNLEIDSLQSSVNRIHSEWEEDSKKLTEQLNTSTQAIEQFHPKETQLKQLEQETAEQLNKIDQLQKECATITEGLTASQLQLQEKEQQCHRQKEQKLRLKGELMAAKRELEKMQYQETQKVNFICCIITNSVQKQLKDMESSWQTSLRSPTKSLNSITHNTSISSSVMEEESPTHHQSKQKIIELQRELIASKSKIHKLEQTLDSSTQFYESQLQRNLEEMQAIANLVEQTTKCRKYLDRKFELHIEHSLLRSISPKKKTKNKG